MPIPVAGSGYKTRVDLVWTCTDEADITVAQGRRNDCTEAHPEPVFFRPGELL
jgi:hypothetical protein